MPLTSDTAATASGSAMSASGSAFVIAVVGMKSRCTTNAVGSSVITRRGVTLYVVCRRRVIDVTSAGPVTPLDVSVRTNSARVGPVAVCPYVTGT